MHFMDWTLLRIAPRALGALLCLAVATANAALHADTASAISGLLVGSAPESPGMVRFGAGIGTPAGVNLLAGVAVGPVVLKVSGGSWGPEWHGLQAGITLNLIQQGWLEQGIAVVAGTYTLKPPLVGSDGASGGQSLSDRYLGLAYDAMFGPVAVQVGLALQDHQREHALVAVQIGYLLTLL
jgi:hypothetical protein